MKQLQKACKEGRVLEIFAPVSIINHMDEDLFIPLDGTDGKAGKLAERIWKELSDIQYGRREHPWSIVVD